MLTINSRNDDYGVTVIGDFWEFDRLYYAIAKFIGEWGANRENPFPEHTLVAQSLLGLSYEIRKAQRGQYGLHVQYNGFPSSWFEDAGKSRELDIDIAKHDYLFDNGYLDDYEFDELYDLDLNILAEKDDEIYWALEEFDDSTVESNPANGIALRFENASNENTLLQFPMTYTEITYYALVLHELLAHKEQFYDVKRRAAENDNGWGMDEMYYYADAHLDIDRLRLFRDAVFQSLYRHIKKDAFKTHLLPLLKKEHLIDDTNLKEWNQLTEVYSKKETQNKDASPVIDYLAQLCKSLASK